MDRTGSQAGHYIGWRRHWSIGSRLRQPQLGILYSDELSWWQESRIGFRREDYHLPSKKRIFPKRIITQKRKNGIPIRQAVRTNLKAPPERPCGEQCGGLGAQGVRHHVVAAQRQSHQGRPAWGAETRPIGQAQPTEESPQFLHPAHPPGVPSAIRPSSPARSPTPDHGRE